MNSHVALLRDLTEAINRRSAIDVARYFTTDFRLDDPGSGALRFGHDGAAAMIDAIWAFSPDVRLTILDVVESGDRVAVRWGVSWTTNGAPAAAAMLAIYRFVNGRIAEDWGVSAHSAWR